MKRARSKIVIKNAKKLLKVLIFPHHAHSLRFSLFDLYKINYKFIEISLHHSCITTTRKQARTVLKTVCLIFHLYVYVCLYIESISLLLYYFIFDALQRKPVIIPTCINIIIACILRDIPKLCRILFFNWELLRVAGRAFNSSKTLCILYKCNHSMEIL